MAIYNIGNDPQPYQEHSERVMQLHKARFWELGIRAILLRRMPIFHAPHSTGEMGGSMRPRGTIDYPALIPMLRVPLYLCSQN
jgi:hypothetical protein